MTIHLVDLFASVPQERLSVFEITGDHHTLITAPVVETDADVRQGGVFVARIGASSDGHRFIPSAIQKGAVAIVGEKPITELGFECTVPYVQVSHALEITGYLAAAYHQFPSRKLIVIGVTGTDGKTTTSTLLHSILQHATDHKTGLISTIAAELGDEKVDTGFHVTTPNAPQVQELLQRMVMNGLTHVVLETTSHGLAQGRLNGVEFDMALLTNVTHEHLDYHGSFEHYRASKGRLFHMAATSPQKAGVPKVSILNRDDANFDFFASFAVQSQKTYGIVNPADYFAEAIEYRVGDTRYTLNAEAEKREIHVALSGRFNVMNSLAAISAARSLDVSWAHIHEGLSAVKQISGRLERIDEGQDFIAMVDFAHTPNALRNALMAGHEMVSKGGRLICVFGCAGLRDREKRRLMPEIAMEIADYSVFTAEDPRTESLETILQTMTEAAENVGGIEGRDFERVQDRGLALYRACTLAQAGDVVLACGKGHEQSMAFGTIEYHWDDRDALRAALRGEPLKTLPTAL